jgi:LPS sulfotransferase NodH
MELVDYMGISESEVTEKSKDVFDISDELLAHDTRYDVVATMISFYKAIQQGLIKCISSVLVRGKVDMRGNR